MTIPVPMTESEYKKEAEKIRPRLVNLARRYMGNSSEADDMVQDAMLKLWAMHGELHSPMEKLACVMVRNQCISSLRQNKPEYSALQLADTTIATDSEEEERGKRIERLMNVMARLPDKQQTVLQLRHMEGMEMADIAELTGSNEVAVRKALSRARQAVRDIYLKERRRNEDD